MAILQLFLGLFLNLLGGENAFTNTFSNAFDFSNVFDFSTVFDFSDIFGFFNIGFF